MNSNTYYWICVNGNQTYLYKGEVYMSGKNPLGLGKEPQAYEGLNVLVPLGGWQVVRAKRDPTTSDKKYPVATLWVNTVSENVWVMTQPAGVWSQLEASGGGSIVTVPNGGTGVGTLAAHGVVVGEGTSAVAVVGPGAVGTVLAGNGGSADPSFQLIPALNIVDVTGTSQAMAANTTYIADNAGLVTFTLPATAAQGTEITISGNGAGGWTIAQNASQVIKMNSQTTTTGVNGSLSSTNRFNSLTMVATVGGASTVWVVNDFSGSFTFV